MSGLTAKITDLQHPILSLIYLIYLKFYSSASSVASECYVIDAF